MRIVPIHLLPAKKGEEGVFSAKKIKLQKGEDSKNVRNILY